MKQRTKQSLHLIFISVCAAMGAFLFGFDTGVINGSMKGIKLISDNSLINFSLGISSMMIGCAIGAFYSGRLSDIYGRRFMLILVSILFIISSFGVGFVDSSGSFIFYRIIGGICVGSVSILVPMYIAEIAPARYRGRLGSIQNMMVICGLFSAFLSNYILTEVSGNSQTTFWLGFETWRWMLWAELLPAILFFIMLLFVPESPRYLVIVGKSTDALAVLTHLYGRFSGEAKLMEITFSLTGKDTPKLADLKNQATGKIQHVLWLGLGLTIFQQLVGINIFYYYGAMIFETIGFNESEAILISVIGALFSLIASITPFFLIDKIGRKKLLFIGSVGMFICLLMFSFTLFQLEKSLTNSFFGIIKYNYLAFIILFIYLILFNISWGPVMWVMLGEIFPNQIRGSGLAVSGFVHWMSNFIVTISFPLLLIMFGSYTVYFLYSLMTLLSICFICFLYETKDRELEQMPY